MIGMRGRSPRPDTGITDAARGRLRGGGAGCLQDPDRHLWESACNPAWTRAD